MLYRLKKNAIRIIAAILASLIAIYRKFRPVPPRIYFCYNQSVHQIHHSIFIAVELSNIQKEFEVIIFSTSRDASSVIEKELSAIPNNVRFVKIHHPGYDRTDFSVNWFVLLCRLRMYKPRAVVVTDYFDNVFKQLLVKTFWVYTFHGPENRGFSDPHIKDYDLVIMPGKGELERIQAKIGLFNNYEIIGYSKFDYFRYHKVTPTNFFKDKKPVIMYNPHFDETQSSFFDKGLELLEALSKTGKYNIIFMPHPDLARRYPHMVNEARALPSVLIADRLKINLLFMMTSDIYITDVSSAVFEWLYFDKPALFFNTKKTDPRSYPAWACGRVVEDVAQALQALDHSLEHPEEFGGKRKEIFDNTFSNRDKNVSKMIAAAICDRLEKARYKPQIFFPWNISKRHGFNVLIFPIAKKLSAETGIRLICRGASPSDFANLEDILTRIDIIPIKRVLSMTPLRWSLKGMVEAEYNLFDRLASRHVENFSPVYAVQGMALSIFEKAQKLGLRKILIVTSLHIELVWRLHKEEEKILGRDYEWLSLRLKNKILKEYEMADLIIAPSKLTYRTFLENGVREDKLEYRPQEIDKDYYKRREVKKDSVFRILYVGRLSPQKGIHYLIKAFQEMELPHSELVLFGATPTRETRKWLDSLVKGWDNIVIRHGDPRPAYEQSSVLVHPSLNDNTGTTVLEALAYDLPVIVTENTGAKELVREGENGFIIPIRDVEAIKEKICLVKDMNMTVSR